MFITTMPTFSATSTNEGNESAAESSPEAARTSKAIPHLHFKISSPDSCAYFIEQALILRVIVLEHNGPLCRVESLSMFPTFEISGAQTEPACCVERIGIDGTPQNLGGFFGRSAIQQQCPECMKGRPICRGQVYGLSQKFFRFGQLAPLEAGQAGFVVLVRVRDLLTDSLVRFQFRAAFIDATHCQQSLTERVTRLLIRRIG